MTKQNKKGFTIVELVIVIAVIAILAAVMIPTFVSLINKANESVDIQATRNMNTALAVDGVVTPTTLAGLYDVLDEAGMDADDYSPLYNGRYFYWDKGLNQILYCEKNTANGGLSVIFPENVTMSKQIYNLSGEFDTTIFKTEFVEKVDSTTNTVTLEVDEAADFVKAAEYIKENSTTYTGATSANTIEIVLSADINLQGADLYFLKDNAKFTNVIIRSNVPGTRRTISGLVVTDEHAVTGADSNNNQGNDYGHSLFYIVKSLTVSDITIADSAILGFEASQAGFFAGQVTGNTSFTNVTVKNCDIQSDRKVGVLAGYVLGWNTLSNVVIENCTVTSAHGEAGKLFGVMLNTNGSIPLTLVDPDEDGELKALTISNTTVNIASSTKTSTGTYTDGEGVEHSVKVVVESANEYRVTTAEYAFLSVSQTAETTLKVLGVDSTGKLYTAIGAEDFE